jgi:DNA-binding NarL/FixJ family response regulator
LTRRSTILLADDHGLILAGIQGLLGGNYEIIEQVRDGRSLVTAALRLRPDLIILDISMPLLNGIEAARHIKKAWPEAKLLFLTMYASPAYLKEAMNAGGVGYILKCSATEELPCAVQKILKGQIYISPSSLSINRATGRGPTLKRRTRSSRTKSKAGRSLPVMAESRSSARIASSRRPRSLRSSTISGFTFILHPLGSAQPESFSHFKWRSVRQQRSYNILTLHCAVVYRVATY